MQYRPCRDPPAKAARLVGAFDNNYRLGLARVAAAARRMEDHTIYPGILFREWIPSGIYAFLCWLWHEGSLQFWSGHRQDGYRFTGRVSKEGSEESPADICMRGVHRYFSGDHRTLDIEVARQMQREIIVGEEKISYTLRKSARSRRMRLAVHRDGSVVLTTPIRSAEFFGERFVYRHAQWLIIKLQFFRGLPPVNPAARYGRREYLAHKEEARMLVMEKIAEFGPRLGGAPYARVNIKDQKTCWGSCSRKGNLNFNYKIVFLPAHLQDYVIVHELAHLRELSHSRRFWAHVASVIPDYAARRRELQAMGIV